MAIAFSKVPRGGSAGLRNAAGLSLAADRNRLDMVTCTVRNDVKIEPIGRASHRAALGGLANLCGENWGSAEHLKNSNCEARLRFALGC